MKRSKNSSIAKKMAGKQLCLLLFFVIPVILIAGWLVVRGLTGSYEVQAESAVVNLENGRITLDRLYDNDEIRFRIRSKNDDIVIFDNTEESAKPILGVFHSASFSYQKNQVTLTIRKEYPLLYRGVECIAEAHINVGKYFRTIISMQSLIAVFYLSCVLLFYLYSIRQITALLRPMKKMTAILNRLSVNNLHSERLDILGVSDEIKDLSIVCNEMLDRIESAYESQKQFVSNASHELRTPIAVIQGYANLLNRWGASDPEILSEAVEAMCNVSKEMQDLVEKLLFLSRHDRRMLKLKKERFDMKEVVEEVFRETEMVTVDRILQCNVSESVKVYGDKQVMKQAIRIFVDNAVKYTEAGDTISIACRNIRNECEVMVEDSGIGMRKKDLDRIFSRFYRADDVRERNISGHGLGLSIAKLIIASHGGRIHIRTQYQKGTAFSFYMPLV